jgi:putative DNA primase/helicase
MNNDAFVKNVASRLIEQIRNGTAPWQKPWRPGTSFLPFNPTNGTRYKGINVVNLLSRGYSDARWMTYRQAQTRSYQVRRGEKGTQVQYWRFDEERKINDSNGRPVIDANGEPRTEKVRLERPQVFIAYVFNAEQIDGVPPAPSRECSWNPLEKAEQLVQAANPKLEHAARDRAFYRPSTDSIHLPLKEQFPSAGDYYSTLLHELGHYAVSRIMPHDRVWRLLCLLSAMRQFGIIRPIRKRRSSVVSGPLVIRYTHKSGSAFAPTPASTSQRLKVF